jgi:hypothetical protein
LIWRGVENSIGGRIGGDEHGVGEGWYGPHTTDDQSANRQRPDQKEAAS